MARLVLVHGSFHGPWCWDKLVPHLERHAVAAPDLGDAQGSIDGQLPGLEDYAKVVQNAVAAEDEPVVLVAHSMGGLVATQAAEAVHERVRAIIYVTGLLLPTGESLTSFLSEQADPAVEDLVLKNMIVSPDGSVATFPSAAATEVFYNACVEDDAIWASERLRPQPTKVYSSPLAVTSAGFGRVPRFYVEALLDRAVPIAMQRKMTALTPCDAIYSLEADHSPFLSATAGLASIIEEVVSRLG
jgi:pimeloyl-ACP methyl ester carboxylesterase